MRLDYPKSNRTKQADVINRVANQMLKDGTLLTGPNVLVMILKDYNCHGLTYKGDPTRMIDKITKIVAVNRKATEQASIS